MLILKLRPSVFAALILSLMILPACQSGDHEDASGDGHAEEAASGSAASERRSASSEGAEVYIIAPADGDTVGGSLRVRFGIGGMSVVAAGTEEEFSGHHHLLIDVVDLPSLETPIPNDANHRHFGGAQKQVELDLEPGTHTLQLILGDHLHVPHEPALISEKITITVK